MTGPPHAVVELGRVLAARYELVTILGSGGMATVFLARDRVLDRDVAVKVLHEQFASDPTFLARFTREALDAARLSHPGLVTIFDAGVDEGTAYIVMELVQGRTAQQVLAAGGPLPIARAVGIAADVCAVLDVAHSAGVVHRDIKPGNILLSDDGRTRVFDFGIARSSGSAALTAIATVIGTADYLSPEQATGGPADARSDLYSVGCVLDAMLTGEPPFTAESPVALLHSHVHDEPEPPSMRRSGVSTALDAAVLHLLAKDPAARPATAAEARLELLATLEPASGSTLLLPTVDAAAAPDRRRVLATIIAVAALVVIPAAVLAVALTRDGTPATAASTPTPASSSVTPSPSTPTPSATPRLTVARATSAAGAIDVVRQVIAAGRTAGLIDASAADQLGQATDAVAATVEKKKGKSAAPRVQGLADLVDSLAAGGQVAPAAAAALHEAIDQLLRVTDGPG
jgi:eukaryotic-like serine/threonine-protein kinase